MGIKILMNRHDFAVQIFSEDDYVLAAFQVMKDEITHLACRGRISDSPILPTLVKDCRWVRSLDLAEGTISDYVLESLHERLESLDITLSEWLSADALLKVTQASPNLRELILAKNLQLNYRAWGNLHKLKHLTSLNLSGCHQLTDSDLKIILNGCTQLTELSIAECKRLLDQSYLLIGRFLRSLQKLDLSKCLLTDSALIDIGFRCHNLNTLILNGCPNITDKGIFECIKRLSVLSELHIVDCVVPDALREAISRERPGIKILY